MKMRLFRGVSAALFGRVSRRVHALQCQITATSTTVRDGRKIRGANASPRLASIIRRDVSATSNFQFPPLQPEPRSSLPMHALTPRAATSVTNATAFGSAPEWIGNDAKPRCGKVPRGDTTTSLERRSRDKHLRDRFELGASSAQILSIITTGKYRELPVRTHLERCFDHLIGDLTGQLRRISEQSSAISVLQN